MLRALTAAHDIALGYCTNLVICMQLFECVGRGSDLMHVAKQLRSVQSNEHHWSGRLFRLYGTLQQVLWLGEVVITGRS